MMTRMITTCLLSGSLVLTAAACKSDPEEPGSESSAGDDIGDATEEAVDDTGDAVDEAAEDVDDEL